MVCNHRNLCYTHFIDSNCFWDREIVRYRRQLEEGAMAATNVEQDMDAGEDMGYDVPFVTYKWERRRCRYALS